MTVSKSTQGQTEYRQLSFEECAEMLNFIDPASLDYAQWLAISMAFWDGTDGQGYDIWDAWNQREPARYNPSVNLKKWNGFEPGEITVGTLIHEAESRGYQFHSNPDSMGLEGIAHPNRSRSRTASSRKRGLPEHVMLFRQEDLAPGYVSDPPETPIPNQIEFLEKIFQPDEFFRIVPYPNPKPNKGVINATARDMLQMLEAGHDPFPNYSRENGVFVCINPLDGKGMKDENVTDFRYALIECDEDPIDKQIATYKALNLPVALVTHSGNKSAHAIVHVDAGQDKGLYKRRVQKLHDALEAHGVKPDRACKNASRLSRMPGYMRGEKPQYILIHGAFNPNITSWNAWESWYDGEQEKTKAEILKNRTDLEAYQDPDPDQIFDEPMGSLAHITRLPFPADLLPGPLRDFVLELQRAKSAPLDFGGGAVLSALSMACQTKTAVQIRPDWIAPLPLFIAIFGKSSAGKSPVYDEVMKPVNAYRAAKNEELEPQIRERKRERDTILKRKQATEKLLKKAISESEKDPDNKDLEEDVEKHNRRLVQLDKQLAETPEIYPLLLYTRGDVTPESFVETAANQGGVYSVSTDEMEKFIGNISGVYSGAAFLEPYLHMYNCKTYTRERMGTGYTVVPNALGSMLLMGQPYLKDTLKSRTLKGQGFWARFLLCEPETGIRDINRDRSPIDTGAVDGYQNVITALFNLEDREIGASGPSNHLLYLSDEAQKLFYTYNDRIANLALMEDGELESIEEMAGKQGEKAARLAALLHCARYHDCPWKIDQISRDEMEAGIAFADYYLSHAKYMYLSINDELIDDCKKIIDRIRHDEPAPERNIAYFQKIFKHNQEKYRKDYVSSLLRELEERNVIRKTVVKNRRGRASTVYEINQRIYSDEGLQDLERPRT